jgi:hypothetical protein
MTAYGIYEQSQRTEDLATKLDFLAAEVSKAAGKRCRTSPDAEARRLTLLADQIEALACELRAGAENQTVRDLAAVPEQADPCDQDVEQERRMSGTGGGEDRDQVEA